MTDIEARLRATLGARLDAVEAPRYLDQRVRQRARRGHSLAMAAAISLTIVAVAGTALGLSALVRGGGHAGPGPQPAQSGYPITPRANGRIAYTASGDTGLELHVVKPDGSDDEVIPTPEGDPWHVAWSPDGSQMALSIFPRGPGDRAIWVMNADGTDPRKLAAAENVSSPTWSPDGAEVVYTATDGDRTEIHRAAANGTYDEVVREEAAEGTFAIFSAQLSPDGLQLLFDRGTDSGYDIFVMSPDGGEARALTTTGNDIDPSWSPDGTKIAFSREEIVESNGSSRATSDIFVMNADGTGVARLSDGGDETTQYSPVWAPDGTKIAFVAGVTGGPGPVVVMNADGTDETELIHSDVIGVSWGPRP